MKYVYLDLNVFNKIEALVNHTLAPDDIPIYSHIEDLFIDDKIIIPYSNAHINDLVRGYKKNDNFISGHISIISTFTKNLCITQYWGEDRVRWHYRDISEFFFTTLNNRTYLPESVSEILKYDTSGKIKQEAGKLKEYDIFKHFDKVYEVDPIFSLMFPKTKLNMNVESFIDDILTFGINLQKDFILYKKLKSFINKIMGNNDYINSIIDNLGCPSGVIPPQFDLNKHLNEHLPYNKTSDNPECQMVTDKYFNIDLQGKFADDKLHNLVDDSLHSFYAAHCDYFITLDKKCKYKSKLVYEELGIPVEVYEPYEFNNIKI